MTNANDNSFAGGRNRRGRGGNGGGGGDAAARAMAELKASMFDAAIRNNPGAVFGVPR